MSYQIPYLQLDTSDVNLAEVLTLCEGTFIKGRVVNAFETAFSSTLGIQHCITTGSGTDALFIALKCMGVGPGDEVITPALSWISSAETISLCHATPVFADVTSDSYTLDSDCLEALITPKTKAVIAVHLYGHAAELASIKSICSQHGLFLIEDCAQAHLSTYHHQPVGSIGDVGTFSFYPTKNLGALGDAGCVVTNHDELAEKMRRFANHGALGKDDHTIEGMNSRMDSIQAAVLLQKLPHLHGRNAKRIANASRYAHQLQNHSDIILPQTARDTTHAFHVFAIRTHQRDALQQYLATNGIQTLIHYPVALPFLPAYSRLGYRPADFPVAASLQKELLSLPIHPGITFEQIDYISSCIRKFFNR